MKDATYRAQYDALVAGDVWIMLFNVSAMQAKNIAKAMGHW